MLKNPSPPFLTAFPIRDSQKKKVLQIDTKKPTF